MNKLGAVFDYLKLFEPEPDRCAETVSAHMIVSYF